MNKRTMRLAAASVLGGATLVVGTAATSSAAPQTALPDADLVCGTTTLTTNQWVYVPPSGTLWVTTGELAGHYVIVSDTHYLLQGYQETPPATYTGLEPEADKTYGTKTAFIGETISCDFVVRWGEPGADGTVSYVGPITMARTGP